MYDNIQDSIYIARATAGCFAVHCFLLRYNYIQLPVLETHTAAARHGTTQTAVNNSEGFMIENHYIVCGSGIHPEIFDMKELKVTISILYV